MSLARLSRFHGAPAPMVWGFEVDPLAEPVDPLADPVDPRADPCSGSG